jgi:hypothetical protein
MTGRERQLAWPGAKPAANVAPIVAIHEAGHAVARVLVAGELG